MFPVQPVVDLENYMQSMERKQQSLEKMIGKLDGHKDEGAKKCFDLEMASVSIKFVHSTHIGDNIR